MSKFNLKEIEWLEGERAKLIRENGWLKEDLEARLLQLKNVQARLLELEEALHAVATEPLDLVKCVLLASQVLRK